LSLFNRSVSLLHTPPSSLSSLEELTLETQDDERLRIGEEVALRRLWEERGRRERALAWSTAVVRFEKETRLVWRWWIWRYVVCLSLPLSLFSCRAVALN
jgi:hypothetical protein